MLALGASSKELKRVTVYGEIGCGRDRGKELGRQAGGDFDYPLTLCAGDMVVVRVATDSIAMCSIREGHPIEESPAQEKIYRSIHCRAPQVGINGLQVVPEVLRRKVGATCRMRSQLPGDQAPRACSAQPHVLEGRQDARGDRSALSVIHRFRVIHRMTFSWPFPSGCPAGYTRMGGHMIPTSYRMPAGHARHLALF